MGTKAITVQKNSGGLIHQPNPLNARPGGLLLADNAVCDREGIIAEKRRGFRRFASLPSTASVLSEFKDRVIALEGSTLQYDSTGSGSMSAYSGGHASPDSNRMKFLEAAGSLFFTTTTGIKKIDNLVGTPKQAGMMEALDVELAQVATTPVWFLTANQVSCRVLFMRRDVNRREIRGAPSRREIAVNSSGSSKSIELKTTIPKDVIAGDYLEVYRTELSGGAGVDPGDEHFLIKQIQITSTHITDRDSSPGVPITFADTLDPIFLTTPLYTNPNEETIDQANAIPPFAKDICQFKGYTFYLNTRREHSVTIQLTDLTALTTGTSTLTFIQSATTRTYTAAVAENITNREFKKETGLPTTAENIAATMKSLERVINRDNGQVFIYARYLEDPETVGELEIRCRDFTIAQIDVNANSTATGNGFNPQIPTSGSAVRSDNESMPHGLYRSKLDEPEAVPYENLELVGSDDSPGMRALGLQDSIILLMEEGIWRFTGESVASFTLKSLDPQIKFKAKDTAAICDNSVFAVCDQGVVKVTENSVLIMSWDPETEIKKAFSFANFSTIAHAVGYNSDRKYLLAAPRVSTDTYATVIWVFNWFTQKWTRWRKNTNSLHVMKTSDLLRAGHAVDLQILEERKSFGTSLDDFKDEEISVTVTAVGTSTYQGRTVSTATFTYTYTGTAMAEGFLLDQVANLAKAKIVSVIHNGSDSYTATLSEELSTLATGAATVAIPIVLEIRLAPEDAENPAVQKDFLKLQYYIETDEAQHHDLGCFTDLNPLIDFYRYYSVEINASAGWGNTPWGDSPWGDEQPTISPIIFIDVPTQYRMGVAFSGVYRNRYANEKVAVLSFALTLRMLGDRTSIGPRAA